MNDGTLATKFDNQYLNKSKVGNLSRAYSRGHTQFHCSGFSHSVPYMIVRRGDDSCLIYLLNA